MRSLRAILATGLLLAFTLAVLPVQLAALRGRGSLKRVMPMIWHRVARCMLGLRVHVHGAPAAGRPLLIAANHQSWADIVALGSVLPCSFIAKSEVRAYPGFGILARLQRTVFVEREARRQSGLQAGAIARRMAEGDAMVLFAEGTTSGGNAVLPFKSSLFGAAQHALSASGREAVLVQPVAIAFTRANGLPLGRSGRPLAAWPGGVELGPHLWAFMRNGAVDCEIVFGQPLAFTPRSGRKAIAAHCERQVARMLAQSLAGRHPPSGEDAAPHARVLASGGGQADIRAKHSGGAGKD